MTKNKLKSIEPKRKNRFIVKLPDVMGINEWSIWSFERPSVHIFKNPFGFIVSECQPIILEIIDPISPSTTSKIWDFFNAKLDIGPQNYASEEYTKEMKDKFLDVAKEFDMELSILDSEGKTVESWDLIGCVVQKIDFGSLNLNDDDIITCKMTIVPARVWLKH